MTADKNIIQSAKTKLRIAAMSNDKRMHVVPSVRGWIVKKEGSKRPSGVYKTMSDAINGAVGFKYEKTSIIIHQKDGSVQLWAGE